MEEEEKSRRDVLPDATAAVLVVYVPGRRTVLREVILMGVLINTPAASKED